MHHLKRILRSALRVTKTILLWWIVFSFVASTIYLGPLVFPLLFPEIAEVPQVQAAALPTLVPGAGTTPNAGDADTATSSNLENEGGTACHATDCYTSIDETVASADTTTFLNNINTNTVARVQGFELTDMPSNFSSMDTLTIDVRVIKSGTRTNDNITLLAQVFEDGGSTALTNQVTICTWNGTTDDCGATWNTITKTFTLQGNNNKTVWDRAELHLTWSTTKSAAADGTEVQVSTAELDGTYTGVSVTFSGQAYGGGDGGALSNCDGSTRNISLVVATSTPGNFYTTCNATTGAFSFNLGSGAIAAGTMMTLYIDGVASTFGTTVIKYSGSGDVTETRVVKSMLLLRNDNSGSITNANLAGFDSDGVGEDAGDTDVVFTSNSNNLSVESGIKVRINPGDTYDPGGTVTTTGTGADFEVATSSLAYFDSSGNTIAGDILVQNTGGTGGTVYFDADTTVNGGDIMATSTSNILYTTGLYGGSNNATSTLTISGTGTITDGNATSTFFHLTTTGSGTTTLRSDITLGGDLTVGSGTTFTNNGPQSITVKGGDATGAGTVTLIGGTFTLTGTGYFGGSANWTFASTTIGNSTVASTTAIGTGTITATSTMTIGSGSYFNLNAKTLKLTGGGWPFVINGHFKPDSSTLSYQGTATSTLVTATTTYNLDFTPAAPAGSQQPSFDLRTGATSWATATDTPDSSFRSLAFDSTNGVLYAGGGSTGTIYRCAISTGCERGDDWTVSYDTTETAIRSLVFVDSTNDAIFAGTNANGQVLRCATSTGCTSSGNWAVATDTPQTTVNSLVFDSTNGVIYGGTSAEGIIMRCVASTDCDAGSEWTVSNNTSEADILSLTIDANSTNKVLYAGSGTGGIIYRCDTTTTAGSCDDSTDWTTAYDTSVANILSLGFDTGNGIIYAGTGSSGFIYRCDTTTAGSCDDSTDWTTVTNIPGFFPQSLAYDSVNNIIYAGDLGGGLIYRCYAASGCDDGSDWGQTYDSSDTIIYALSVDTINGVVYAGSGTATGAVVRGTITTEATVLNNLTITNAGGGTPTVKAPKKLTIGGNYSNCSACTFTHNSGRVVFNATATGKSLTTAGDAFYDLVFDGSGGGWRLEDNATSTYMSIKRGTVDAFSKTIALTGSGQPFVNLGSFNASTSTLRFTGTSPTYIDNHQTFNNVEIDPASGTQTYTIGNWYTSGGNTWNYRKKIVVDKTKVSGNASLDSFPVLIAETDANLKTTGNGGGVGQSAGQDLLFTDYTGTLKLDHEIEKYTATTGELVAWVRLPSLNTATDTVLYLYYGNPTVANQENITGVWDSNFKGVWHLDEGDSTAADFYKDSTSNNNHGTLTDANGNTNQGDGKVGKAMDFNGDADYIAVGSTNFPNGTRQSVSLSAWVNIGVLQADFDHVIIYGNGTAGQTPVLAFSDTYWLSSTVGAANDAAIGTPAAGVWRHLAGTCNAALGTTRIYVDGIFGAEKTGATCNPNAANAKIGALFNGTGNWVDGIIDEARVSAGVRSDQWIATEYNNQSATNTFYVLGPQVASSTAVTVNGAFFLGGAGGATTADLNTNDPVFDVNGNFTISSGDTFSASSAATTTAAANFTNNGTFTHNNGTIKFDSSTTQTIFGNTTFYGFFATTTAATLKFENAKTTTIASGGTFTILGKDGGKITLNSDSAGNQWKIYLLGTASVNWVNLKDCGCAVGTLDITPTNASNGGNNGSCWGVSTIASTGGGPAAVDGSGGGTARTGGGTSGGSGSTGGGSGGGSGQSGGGTGGGGGATP